MLNVPIETAHDKVFGLGRYAVKVCFLAQVNIFRSYEELHLLLILAWEWVSSRKKHVGNDTYGPDVYLFIILLAFDNLRSHVHWGSKYKVKAGFWVKETGEAKVRYLYF